MLQRTPGADGHTAQRVVRDVGRNTGFNRQQPIEIAQAVMFFLSDRSDYITGQVLSVSGGLTMAD